MLNIECQSTNFTRPHLSTSLTFAILLPKKESFISMKKNTKC